MAPTEPLFPATQRVHEYSELFQCDGIEPDFPREIDCQSGFSPADARTDGAGDQLNVVVNTATETVYDMQPGETGSGAGKIFKYQISTSYDWIHFDAYGFHRESDGHFKFAPNSHDAEKSGNGIPEPATMMLFGLGLAGTAFFSRKK